MNADPIKDRSMGDYHGQGSKTQQSGSEETKAEKRSICRRKDGRQQGCSLVDRLGKENVPEVIARIDLFKRCSIVWKLTSMRPQ